jgi:hypothetical protein
MSPLVGLGKMKVCRAISMRVTAARSWRRARDRGIHQLRHDGKIDRVEVKQIGLWVRVDKLELDRLWAGEAIGRKHRRAVDYSVLPPVDMIAIVRLLRFDRDAARVNFDPQHARILTDSGAQRRHCRVE